MATRTDLIDKSNQSKNIITYVIIGVVFLVALWLSTQSEGPSKFPNEVHQLFRPLFQNPPCVKTLKIFLKKSLFLIFFLIND